MTSAQTACDRCQSPLESDDLRCSICGHATPTPTAPTSRSTQVKILRCTGCGAAVEYDAELQAPGCGFCESIVEIESIDDPMEQAEGYLPFTVSPDEAHQALKQWLGSQGWLKPSDLQSTARLEKLRPLWWAGWLINADAFVSWAADSDAGSGRSAWAPHSGQTQMDFSNILISASRGLTGHESSTVTSYYNPSTANPRPQKLGNAVVEQFDLQRSQARRQITDALKSAAQQRIAEIHVPGTRTRNVRTSVLLRSLTTRRLAFPAWVLAYRYRSQLYRVVICGQDASCVTGSAPNSRMKIALVVTSLVTVAALIAWAFARSASVG